MCESRSDLCPPVRVVERNGSGADQGSNPSNFNGFRDAVFERPVAREARTHEAATNA